VRNGILRNLVQSTRTPEAVLMCGFPAMGFALGLAGAPSVSLPRLALFLPATLLLSLGVYVFNGWANSDHDVTNPRFAANWITHGTIPLTGALLFSLTAAALGVAIFAVTSRVAAVLALALFCLFAAYSHPGLGFKQGAVAPTAIHLAGGFLMFWLGYVMARPLDGQGVVLATFFSLVFTAGHFNHEALDMDADREAGLTTRAVRWGLRASLNAGIASFAVAEVVLAVATILTWPRLGHTMPFLIIAPFHGLAFARVIRNPSNESIRHYRHTYRLLFLSAGAASAFLLWWFKSS